MPILFPDPPRRTARSSSPRAAKSRLKVSQPQSRALAFAEKTAVAAMPNGWYPPQVTQVTAVKGGLLKQPMPITVKVVENHLGVPEEYVKLTRDEEWLQRAVFGKDVRRGLKRTTLFEKLRKAAGSIEEAPAPSAVADVEDDAAVGAAPDPMEALADLKEPGPSAKKGRYQRKPLASRMKTVTMPECETTRHPNCSSTTEVKLLLWTTTSLWVRTDSIPWVVTWLADEVSTQGIPFEAAPTGIGLANSTAVAGVKLEWDFSTTWTATVLTGEHQGKIISTSVGTLNEEKWAKVCSGKKLTWPFQSRTAAQQKEVAMYFLELHLIEHLGLTPIE